MKKLSVRTRCVLGIALIEVVVLFFLTANSLAILETSHSEQLSKRADTLTSLLADAVARPLASSDVDTLNRIATQLLQHKEILAVRVHDSSRLLVNQQQAELPSADTGMVAFTAREDIQLDGKRLGMVELSIDRRDIDAAMREARNQSLKIALIGIVLVALASIFMGRYLFRMLNRLQEGIEQAHQGQFEEIAFKHSDPDTSALMSAFNRLVRSLKRSQEESHDAITESRAMAVLLMQRENWLETVIDNIADAILTVSPEGAIQSCNASGLQMFEADERSLIGRAFTDLSDNDERKAHLLNALQKDSSDTGSLTMIEERLVRRNGEAFLANISLRSTLFNQEPIRIVVIRDQSKMQDIEQKAEASEAIKSAILESSLSAVVAIDIDDGVVEFNPSAERIFGFSRQEVIGKPMAEMIMPKRFRAPHRIGIKRYLESGYAEVFGKRLELVALRKSGEEFPIEMSVTPVHSSNGVLFTAVMDDITARLESTRRLEEARDAANQANEAKSTFLTSMSHEIRTPLNVILGMVNLLQNTELNSLQREYLMSAGNAGHSLLGIINEILDLAKIEAGKMKAKAEPFNPGQLVETAVAMFRQQAWTKGLSLNTFISYRVPAIIENDPIFFRQILVNLVGNAIKFTQKGSVTVVLDIQFEHGMNHLKLSVEDTGEGIEKSKFGHIFEEFSQVHRKSEGSSGTGLGLVICRELSNLMGGDMGFTSELGKGSTFSLSLVIPELSVPAKPNLLQDVNILLLGPDPAWIAAVQRQLADWSVDVQVLDTQDKVDALISEHPEQRYLVFSDDSGLGLLDKTAYRTPQLPEKNVIRRFSVVKDGQSAVSGVLLRHPLTRNALFMAITQSDQNSVAQNAQGVLIQDGAVMPDGAASFSVLLVDDSSSNRIIARAYLEEMGGDVTEAEDGQDCLNQIQQKAFDLILMDMRMPVMGGIEASTILRSEELAPHTPIIALTAHALVEEKENCLSAGMQDFLTKPIDKALLQQRVRYWVTEAETSRREGRAYKISHAEAGTHKSNSFDDSEPVRPATEKDARPPLLKMEYLQQLEADTNANAVRRMLGIFETEVRKRVISIQENVRNDDFEQLENSVHALKSSSLTFGAYRLHTVAKEAEQMCKDNHYEEAILICQDLPALIDLSLKALFEVYPWRDAPLAGE